MTEPAAPQLSKKELDAMREIHISINWKGFRKAWMKMFYDAPFEGHQKLMRGIEGVSRKMMTGNGSLLGMPVGIILRNTSRAMHNTVKGRDYYKLATAVSVIGSIGAVAMATVAAAPVVAPFVGTWVGYVAAGAVSAATVSIPAYTAATLIVSGLVGAATGLFSTIASAPVNMLFGPALARFKAARKGVKLTEEQIENLQTEFDRESPSKQYQRDMMYQVERGLANISESDKEKVYKTLKAEFDEKASKSQQTAVAAAPATKTSLNP